MGYSVQRQTSSVRTGTVRREGVVSNFSDRQPNTDRFTMQAIQFVLLLLAVVALAAAAPTPDGDDYEHDYDYGSYEDDADDYRLPSSMFDDLRPQPVQQGSPQPTACSWAVVHCCGVPNRMGSRASCFSRLGCSGAWFSDICTPAIQKNILKGILSSQKGL